MNLREAARDALLAWDANSESTRTYNAMDALRATLDFPPCRPCTCHPEDNPPVPCQRKYALAECRAAAALAAPESTQEPVLLRERNEARDQAAAANAKLLSARAEVAALRAALRREGK